MAERIKINLNDMVRIKEFIAVAREFASDIDVITDRTVVDGKSILGLYALDLSNNVWAQIISDNIEEIRKFDAAMEEFRA